MVSVTTSSSSPLNRASIVRRRSAFAGAGILLASIGNGAARTQAAVVEIELKNLRVEDCATKRAGGTPGTSSYKARCYRIIGDASNPSPTPVLNADVYGKIVDAANDPVLRSGRVGSLVEIPPGESTFELQITAAATQTLPFKLSKFKAEGFTQIVNRSENPADTDYEKGVFPKGTKTIL